MISLGNYLTKVLVDEKCDPIELEAAKAAKEEKTEQCNADYPPPADVEEEGEAPDEEDKELEREELADQREEELDAQVSACPECFSLVAGSDVMLLQAALLEEEESDEEESDDEEAAPAAVTMAEGELIPVVSLLKNVTKM